MKKPLKLKIFGFRGGKSRGFSGHSFVDGQLQNSAGHVERKFIYSRLGVNNRTGNPSQVLLEEVRGAR